MTWDVAVKISPEADRIAYDLLEHGTAVDRLIVQKFEKIRRDEASMTKTWNGAAESSENDEPAETAPATGANAAPAEVAPIDLVLQRAVHLHRALLALKKIPPR